jgi:hypothetical protein
LGTQVALTAVIRAAGHLHYRWFITAGQGEVRLGVGGVNVVAGAAVKRGNVYHALNRSIMWWQAGIDAGLGSLTAVTTSAGSGFASDESFAGPMHRTLFELRLFGNNQRGVIVAFGAG